VNYLSGSLCRHCKCYNHTRFMQFKERSGLPFKPYEHFKKADLNERSALYRQIAKCIWNPDQLLQEVDL
jgi:hypothetical protein